MAQMNIRFHADRDEIIFPDLDAGDAAAGQIVEAVIVANGVSTPEGKARPSVVLRIATDEQTVIVLTTARLVVTLARAILAKHEDLMEGE